MRMGEGGCSKACGEGIRLYPYTKLQYSKENIEYFSQYEVNAINAIVTIVENILKSNGLFNHLIKDEFDILVGNQKKAKKIHIKPIPGEDDPDLG